MGEQERYHHHHGEGREGEQGGPGEHRRPHWDEPRRSGPGGRRGWHHGSGEGRGVGPRLRRRFLTREERIARLEEYLRQLQAEAKAVEERLAELRG